MLDKSVCDVSIGEETVDVRSPNFAFLSLMNVGPMGPALARGGKLTLARCVWYPGPGLMEKACFHSCQSHLLRATPRLHTHGKDHRLSISHTPRPSPAPRQFVFVILWTSLGGNYEQNNTNNTRRCVFIASQRCVWVFYLPKILRRPEWMIGASWFRLQVGLLRTYCVGLCVSGKCMICGTSGLHTCRTRGGERALF